MRAPALLRMPLHTLADTCVFLTDVGLRDSKLWCPPVVEQLLRCQLDSRLKPTVFHLLSLGMPPDKICLLLCRYPSFARFSVISKQRPLVEWLRSAYEIPLPGVRTILLRHPKIVGNSFAKIDEVAALFSSELGIESRAFGVCLVRFPGLVSLSVAMKLQPTIRALLGLGLTSAQVGQMVCEVPALLSLDFSPGGKQWLKWRFLLDVMHKGPQDVLSFPRYFTCSLARRIGPRVLFMLQHGVRPVHTSLQKVLSLTDQNFAERTVGRPLDEYLLFQSNWMEAPLWREWIAQVETQAEKEETAGRKTDNVSAYR